MIKTSKLPRSAALRPVRENQPQHVALRPQRFGGADEMSTGEGAALRRDARAKLGASGLDPIGPTPLGSPDSGRKQKYGNTCGANTLMNMEDAAGIDTSNQTEEDVYKSQPGFRPRQKPNMDPAWSQYAMHDAIVDKFGGTATIEDDKSPKALADSVFDVVKSGRPVAIGLPGHWVAAVAYRKGPPEAVLIKDSWSGKEAWVTKEELEDGSWIKNHDFSDDSVEPPTSAVTQSGGLIGSIVYPDALPRKGA